MTVDANAYLISDAVSESATPIIYGEEDVLRKVLFDAQELPQRMDNISQMAKGAGNSIQLPSELSTWSVSSLTEGTITPVSALQFGADSLVFTWYGDAKQWTLEAESVVFPYVLSRMRSNALQAIGENRDTVIYTELLNTTSAAIYPVNGSGVAYTSSDIDATATFQYAQVARARTQMKINKLKLNFVLYHPLQELSVITDSSITDNTKYNNNVIRDGTMVDVYGTELIAHNVVSTATENSQTVYIGLACMAKPAFYANKVEPMMEVFKENPRERAWTFHYFEAFGAKLKRVDGIIPLKSVGGAI